MFFPVARSCLGTPFLPQALLGDIFLTYSTSLLQNVAAGFSLRFNRMEDLGLPAIFFMNLKRPHSPK
jgi:hypothetical protein